MTSVAFGIGEVFQGQWGRFEVDPLLFVFQLLLLMAKFKNPNML